MKNFMKNTQNGALNWAIVQAEKGYFPDTLLRYGIRKLCQARLAEMHTQDPGRNAKIIQAYVESLINSPLAVFTEKANEQHYEVPAEFYRYALGKNLKYSSCYYASPTQTLTEAEDQALQMSCDHAELANGQRILELGCGWGSLSLWMAKHFPQAKITSISNSHSQRDYIMQTANARGLNNLTVLTQNLAEEAFDLGHEEYDRVVSIEMLEHFRNYEKMFQKISRALKKDGKFFCHIFTHRHTPYFFETAGQDNWLGRHFFTGGQMPSAELFLFFQKHLHIQKRWAWSGEHYQKTAEHWLENTDRHKKEILALFEKNLPAAEARRTFGRWRIFFMACAELFGFDQGAQWGVNHYLFSKAGER